MGDVVVDSDAAERAAGGGHITDAEDEDTDAAADDGFSPFKRIDKTQLVSQPVSTVHCSASRPYRLSFPQCWN